MRSAAANKSDSTAGDRVQVRILSADALIYIGLTVLVWLTWRVNQMQLFEPGDDIGYWIGVTGAVMMLLLLLYPLRKYFRFAHGWGNIRFWFWLHVFLGIGGPTLILLHSHFRTGSLNAAVAFYSMLLVAGSGLVGRFIFRHINRGLDSEQSDFQDLLRKAGMDREDAHSRLAFAPGVEQRLTEFREREIEPRQGLLNFARAVLWLPLLQWRMQRGCVADLDALLVQMAARQHWTRDDLKRRRRQARKMVGRYLDSVVRVAQFNAYSFLFSLWHVAHIPFVYVLILTTLVHVYAVHAY